MVNNSRSYFISHAMDYAGISCESGKSELALTIYPVYEAQTLYDTLCQGQTYTQHGLNETFNQAGSFDRVLNTVSSTNCDSFNTIFYVRSIDPITSCNSANTTVQVIIASVPGFPSTANVARCGAGAITLTATPNTANTCRWYNAESELVYEGTSFEIANLEETTTFTCKSYNSETGCESSNSRSVIATINPIPDVPTVNGNNPICGSGAIQMTGVPGTNATVCRWINGNDTTTNNSFSTGNISQSTDYLVQSYNANTRCASDNITVSVVVNSLPTAPQTGNDSQCLGTEVTLTATAAEHSIVRWYASAQDNNILYEGSEFHPANLVVGENNFYASAYDTLTQCSSAEK